MLSACVDHGPAAMQKIADQAAETREGLGFLVAVTDSDGGRTVGIGGTDAYGEPMTADVTWVIGSVTKTFVAIVMMQLIDEGVLSLEDSVSTYIDHDFIPDGATIFDVLHHSSGIQDYVANEEWANLMATCPSEAPFTYDFVEDVPQFQPGTAWSYSNTNYVVLGDLIHRITDMRPELAIRSRILEPLGLDDTYLGGAEGRSSSRGSDGRLLRHGLRTH
jgi:CubicO group peptidase (beta-lactamase class C family)